MLVLAAHFFGMNLGRQQPRLERLMPWLQLAFLALPFLLWLLHRATRPSREQVETDEKALAAHNALWDKIEARAIQLDIQKEFREEKNRRPLSLRLTQRAKYKAVYDVDEARSKFVLPEEETEDADYELE
jgi:hypothetical protein